MLVWLKKFKMYVLIGIIILVFIAIYLFFSLEKEETENSKGSDWLDVEEIENKSPSAPDDENTVEKPEEVWVDVKGAIMTPGVYPVSQGDRVIDVIKKAGGLLDTADQNNINFAMKVEDEMVVYIPAVGENVTGIANQPINPSQETGKININSASNTELQTLPGIGESKAAAIIEYREKNGPFKKVEDLMEISGIGIKTFEKLKDQIDV